MCWNSVERSRAEPKVTYMERNAEKICPYNFQSENVSRICDGSTGLPYLKALLGSFLKALVTIIEAWRGGNNLQERPKNDFGLAGP